MKSVKSLFKVYEISIRGVYSNLYSVLVSALEYIYIYMVTTGFPFPEACLFFPDVMLQCLDQSFLNNFFKDCL